MAAKVGQLFKAFPRVQRLQLSTTKILNKMTQKAIRVNYKCVPWELRLMMLLEEDGVSGQRHFLSITSPFFVLHFSPQSKSSKWATQSLLLTQLYILGKSWVGLKSESILFGRKGWAIKIVPFWAIGVDANKIKGAKTLLRTQVALVTIVMIYILGTFHFRISRSSKSIFQSIFNSVVFFFRETATYETCLQK